MQFSTFMKHLKRSEWFTLTSWLMEEFSGVQLLTSFSLSHRWKYTNTSLTGHYTAWFFYSRWQRERHVCLIKLPDIFFFFSWHAVNKKRERADGCDRKRWEFKLQIQCYTPQMLSHLSINHICAQYCDCATNGINFIQASLYVLCHFD